MRFHYAALVAILLSIAPALRAEESAMEYRGWTSLSGDVTYLKDFAARAHAAGMNRLQLCHGVVDPKVERLLEGRDADAIQSRVQTVCRDAHAAGLKVDMWVNELSSAPDDMMRDGKVVLDKRYWKWVEGKYDRVFARVPEIDGLVVTAWETPYAVIKDDRVISKLAPAERLAEMVQVFAGICDKYDKDLIFRTFSYVPEELAAMRDGLRLAAGRSEVVRRRTIVMIKCVPADWTPFFPYNPVFGNVGGLREIVEVDLGQEYSGQSQLLYGEVDFVKRVLDYAREHGAIGAVARVDRWERSAIGTPNEVNLYACSQVLNGATDSAEYLWRAWCNQRYGEAAALHVMRALQKSYDINNAIFFPLHEWVAQHSRVPSWDYVQSIMGGWSRNVWINSPEADRSREEFFHPTPELLTKLSQEKEMARRLNREAREEIIQARMLLKQADYNELMGYLERNDMCIDVYDHHHQALFSALRYLDLDTPQLYQEPRERMALRFQVLAHLAWLEKLGGQVEAKYGADFLCANKADIEKIRADITRRLQLEDAAKLRDQRFMETTEEGTRIWQSQLRRKLFDLLRMNDLVAREKPAPFNAKTVSETDHGAFVLREIELDSTPTRRIRAILGIPKGVGKGTPAVVCIGGHGSNRETPYEISPRSLYGGFGVKLTELGYITISTDVAQHEVYEEGRTMMGERLWDLMRTVDYLESMPEVDTARIGCGGLSLGGEMTMWLGAMDPRMKVSVSCGFLTLMDQMEVGHCMCWKEGRVRELVDYPDIYALTAPRYLQCQNGLREPVGSFYVPLARVALEEIRPAYEALGAPKNVELFVHDGGHVINVPAFVAYMEEHL